MKLWARHIFVVAVLCIGTISSLFFQAINVSAYTSPGAPQGYVSDFAKMLSSDTKATLTATLSEFKKTTGSEVAVVTITSLKGDVIEDYANALYREWGIGKKGTDNGILLLISRDDRKVRIEVGYGLEGALTDAQSNTIIQRDIVPAFKAGNYDVGVRTAVEHIIAATQGEYTVPSSSIISNDGGISGIHIIAFFFVILSWITSILGRSKSWWLGGVLGGIAGIGFGVHMASLAVGGISFIVLLLLGLLFDFIVSRTYSSAKSSGSPIPWWIGGGGFGGGGRGGGFGGFSGGSSGGGGSSGSW